MATISLTLPSDGQTIDASDVNNPLNTIAAEINGNLDNANIKAGAAIERSKIAGFTDGWEALGYAPSAVTANGNRSYDLTISSVDITGNISPGMRLKLTRTVTAPTQCTDLEAGSSQYYSKTSPSGMTFSDDWTCSAWIKLESYGSGYIITRESGTSGWAFNVNSSGQIDMYGWATGNGRRVTSYQSVPLNKWVHIAASMDLSGSSGLVYIDGTLVPSVVANIGAGSNTLTQAGDFRIGASTAGASYFDGKIAQAAVYSAVLSAATIKAAMNQTLTGSETNLVSAYSFNGVITDLAATDNDLTAQGSAVATDTDTPFTQAVTNTSITAGTTNYAIVTKASFSTNTTLTVQVPEGDTIPTSGGVSAVSYSTQKVPYGFPSQRGKWTLATFLNSDYAVGTAANTWYGALFYLTIPVGEWSTTYNIVHNRSIAATVYSDLKSTLSTTTSTEVDPYWTDANVFGVLSNALITRATHTRTGDLTVTTQAPYYGLVQNANNNSDAQHIGQYSRITAYPAYL